MTKKEDLQKNLQELEARLLEIRDKEDQTLDDLKEANGLCDQIEELNENLRTLERMNATVEGIRKPTSEPADPGQPDNRTNQGFVLSGFSLCTTSFLLGTVVFEKLWNCCRIKNVRCLLTTTSPIITTNNWDSTNSVQ